MEAKNLLNDKRTNSSNELTPTKIKVIFFHDLTKNNYQKRYSHYDECWNQMWEKLHNKQNSQMHYAKIHNEFVL